MAIYHITTQSAWQEARKTGQYGTPSLETEGFVHCSTQTQVSGTAARYFKGQENLVLLVIDETQLQAPLRLENTTGESEAYPHVYGPLNLDSIIEVRSFQVP